MNMTHVILAHGGRGGFLGLILASAILVFFLVLAFSDKQSSSKKD